MTFLDSYNETQFRKGVQAPFLNCVWINTLLSKVDQHLFGER